jgi:hypothetical protein
MNVDFNGLNVKKDRKSELKLHLLQIENRFDLPCHVPC